MYPFVYFRIFVVVFRRFLIWISTCTRLRFCSRFYAAASIRSLSLSLHRHRRSFARVSTAAAAAVHTHNSQYKRTFDFVLFPLPLVRNRAISVSVWYIALCVRRSNLLR